ncbi:MAG TPA: histidine phosphatase family protein [Beijerinckiaceae bacterium]|jgi:probable phosphoglycerate mutase
MNGIEGGGRRRVYLMRHAEVSYFAADGTAVDPRSVTLTERGRAQAAAMAEALAEVPFDRAVCSGMPRSRDTAAAVLAARAIDIEDEPDFREIRAGRLREVPPERRRADLVYALESAALEGARFAGGESFMDFEARVLAAFTRLLSDPTWRRLLLVAHDAVNRVLLAWAAQAGLAALAAFEQDMGCLNLIDLDMADGMVERRIIRLVNYTPYDPVKAKLFLTSMEQVFGTYAATSPSPG